MRRKCLLVIKHHIVFAEHFLSDGNISVDISVNAAPIITGNYIESYHKVSDIFKRLWNYTQPFHPSIQFIRDLDQTQQNKYLALHSLTELLHCLCCCWQFLVKQQWTTTVFCNRSVGFNLYNFKVHKKKTIAQKHTYSHGQSLFHLTKLYCVHNPIISTVKFGLNWVASITCKRNHTGKQKSSHIFWTTLHYTTQPLLAVGEHSLYA